MLFYNLDVSLFFNVPSPSMILLTALLILSLYALGSRKKLSSLEKRLLQKGIVSEMLVVDAG